MVNKKVDTVVLDLDETLINSYFITNDKSMDFAKEFYGHLWDYIELDLGSGEKYFTFLRSWSRDLVSFCKNLVGEENVFILSTGITSYVKEVNSRLSLGVLDDHIYGREDIKRYGNKFRSREARGHPQFEGRNNILLDNESYQYHNHGSATKVWFLDNLSTLKYIEVVDFDVRYFNPPDDDNYLDILKDKITKTLAL